MAALGTAMVLAGCVTPAQFLDSKQGMATQYALARGQFEMSCPTAQASVLSREVVQPPMRGPWVGGVQRAEYTIGVAGCDRRTTYVVVCALGSPSCFAAASR
jgi:hypothetical protein